MITITGHRQEQSVEAYDSGNEDQQRQLSNIIDGKEIQLNQTTSRASLQPLIQSNAAHKAENCRAESYGGDLNILSEAAWKGSSGETEQGKRKKREAAGGDPEVTEPSRNASRLEQPKKKTLGKNLDRMAAAHDAVERHDAKIEDYKKANEANVLKREKVLMDGVY
ncbi:hypothetical protein ACROYT_G013912 [Oculina patagonica]